LAICKPTTDNGFYYQTTNGGSSAASEPTWKTDGTDTTDGTVTWARHWLGELISVTADQVAYGQVVQNGNIAATSVGSQCFVARLLTSLMIHGSQCDDGWAVRVAAGETWQADHEYSEDDIVVPVLCNGFYYVAEGDGTSGSTEPVWSVSQDTGNPTETTDNDITWVRLAYGTAVQIFAGDNPALNMLELAGVLCDVSGGWLRYAIPADFDMLAHKKRRKL
jgi:hypothetical protein